MTKQFQSVKFLLQSCQLSLDYHQIFPRVIFNISNGINNFWEQVSKVLVSYPNVSTKIIAPGCLSCRQGSPRIRGSFLLPLRICFWHATLEINLLCWIEGLLSTEWTRLFDDCLSHGCPHSGFGAVRLLWWLSWHFSNGILLFLVEAGKKEHLVHLWCLITTKCLPGLLECFSSILLLLRTSSSCDVCQGPGLGALLSASRYWTQEKAQSNLWVVLGKGTEQQEWGE